MTKQNCPRQCLFDQACSIVPKSSGLRCVIPSPILQASKSSIFLTKDILVLWKTAVRLKNARLNCEQAICRRHKKECLRFSRHEHWVRHTSSWSQPCTLRRYVSVFLLIHIQKRFQIDVVSIKTHQKCIRIPTKTINVNK